MASSFGISPMEAAFEVVGLVNCKQIMNFLFVDTRIGVAIVLVGYILSFIQTFKKQDFSYLFSYFFMSIALWALFIKPVVNFGDTRSAMEKEGWTPTTSKDYLVNELSEENKVSDGGSLGLVYMSRGLNAIVQGTIKAITKATGTEDMNYLKNPFIVNKVSAYLKDFTANGITEPGSGELAYDVNKFLVGCYHNTLTMVAQDSGPERVSKKWWPGHEDIVARYCSKCKEDCAGEWIKIDKELDGYIKKHVMGVAGSSGTMKIGGRNISKFFDISNKNTYKTLKIKLLGPEVGKSAADIMTDLGNVSNLKKARFEQGFSGVMGALGWVGGWLGQGFTTVSAMTMIKMFPHIQAYFLLIAYSLFPFTLLICLLLRIAAPLVLYFSTLFWLKSWSIVWAIIHYASIYMAEMQSKLYAGSTSDWFIEQPYFLMVTNVLLIMSPAISWFFVKGVLSGIGEVTSATTLHADKAIGKAKI